MTEHSALDEPQQLSRRKFLIGAGAITGVALVGTAAWRFADAGSPSHKPQASGSGGLVGGGPFVLVTLYGGNDGLNTVVPYQDVAYHTARPTLGYADAQVLPLADGLGLNPQLKGLAGLWKGGQLAIVRGVGYPNPNLSHFSSTAIWQSGDPSGTQHTGWLGRWLDATGTDPLRAVSIGPTLPLVLRGDKQAATALTAPTIQVPGDHAFQQAYATLQGAGPDRAGLLGEVAGSGADLLSVQGRLDRLSVPATAGTPSPGSGAASGPPTATTKKDGATKAGGTKAGATDLSGQLALVAALINAGSPTRVYQVSLASFDTHANEKANHERLLGELDAAVTSFLQQIAGSVAGRRTVLLTVSEFGRRPAENASGGTDHGTAAPLFVAGHGVRGGRFYGDEPSLTKLDANGNLAFNVDFRSVYATVLDKVVGVDPKPVLGGTFSTLDFV